jgi:hypothetical protein
MDLDDNQILICHHDFIGPKILAMCIKCKKGLITYHKSIGITTTQKHVETNHFALLKKLIEDLNIALVKTPFSPLYLHLQFLFFKNIERKFKKDDLTQIFITNIHLVTIVHYF